MGEGRRSKRTAKRRRTALRGAQKSYSDSEVKTQSKFSDRKSKKDLLPWPKSIESLTVDELARYRRKRIQDGLKDTLGTHYHQYYGDSESIVDHLITEYRRAFRTFSEDSLLLRDHYSRPYDPSEASNVTEQIDNTDLGDPDVKSMESNSGLLQVTGHTPRTQPIRRGTCLRRGGEFYSDTESSNYKTYEGIHRAELARRPTSLKIEGDMQTVTEQCDKFIEWLNVSRPELARNPTHLKLEGRLETSTECHDQYVPFVGARRPEILRQSAHLKLEGDSNFIPEYADVFRAHNTHEKRTPIFPETHLKPESREFVNGNTTENLQNFIDPRGAVPISDNVPDNNDYGNHRRYNQNDNYHRKNDDEQNMNMLVSKLEHLKGPPLEVPEYKDAYKDFPRERPKLLKPEDEIGRADGSKIHPSSSANPIKFSTKIDQDPEYKSKYLDRGTERIVYRKPPASRRPSIGSSGFGKRLVPDIKHYPPTSEVRSQYVPYGHVPRVETLRMPINLRPEGSMNLQPEYRDAYCRKRDHNYMDSRRRHSRDRSLSGSRRHENNWIHNNSSNSYNNNDPTDLINYENDAAFQVLHSKADNNNVGASKPPIMGSRRNSTISQAPRSTHLDVIKNSASLKNQSSSPTYRLHVCNVDDEEPHRNFTRRRRSSLSLRQITSPGADPTIATIEDINLRPYSPSFGKNTKNIININKNNSIGNNNINSSTDSDGNQAFVVVDNARISNNRDSSEERRKHIDNNTFNNDLVSSRDTRIKYRNKAPPNWMPPWYDTNTNTI